MSSEFGKGLTYCIGLFLAHAERKDLIRGSDYSMWFNGAADHLYELQIPGEYPDALIERLSKFQETCINWRLNWASEEDFKWAVQEAKDLLREIDETNGIETEKGYNE